MTVLYQEFRQPEKLNAQIQSKLTETEFKKLEAIRDELLDAGVDVTLSSVVRTFVLSGINAFEQGGDD